MSGATRFIQRRFNHDLSETHLIDDWGVTGRVCHVFVRSKGDNETCYCGRPEASHTIPNEQNSKWNMEKHTIPCPTKHGVMPNGALYVRVSIDTKLSTIEKILYDAWKIKQPKLIMSIIGGSKYFTLNDQYESDFIQGIIDVVRKSEVWTITTGFNLGVVQLVGQAIHKYRLKKSEKEIIAIGICKWGSVRKVEELTSSTKNRINPKIIPRISKENDEEQQSKLRRGEADLELNHGHFLMVDDGRYHYFNTDRFRTRLCSNIVNKSNHQTSAVTIVVEGGHDTLANIYYDVKAKIPVVVFNGSGRAADFISRWLAFTKEFDQNNEDKSTTYEVDESTEVEPFPPLPPKKQMTKDANRTTLYAEIHVKFPKKRLLHVFENYHKLIEEELKEVLSLDLPTNPDISNEKSTENSDKIKTTLNYVLYCLQPSVRSFITVFNLNSDDVLSDIIFESICKSHTMRTQDEKEQQSARSTYEQANDDRKNETNSEPPTLLEIAMDWDCIKIAKEYIFQDSLQNISDPPHFFRRALEKNLPTFVNEFIKLDIDLVDIFFPGNSFKHGGKRYSLLLKYLYNSDRIKSNIDFKTFVRDVIKKDAITTTDELNAVFREIIGDYMYKLYYDTFQAEEKSWRKSGLNYGNKVSSSDVETKTELSYEEESQLAIDYILRDLFLWAIVMNYVDMAKVFLAQMKYRICPALIATKIFKQFHERAKYGDVKHGYSNSADYFEKYAVDCVDKCDDHDADKTCQLVLQQNRLYGYTTCIQIAADARDKEFIATDCCVQAMNYTWYDKLYSTTTSNSNKVRLFIGLITLGLINHPVVKFRSDEVSEVGTTVERSLDNYGIDYCDPYPLEHPRWIKGLVSMDQYFHRVRNFHLSLPAKFFYHCITYLFFLLLFSYVLLFKFQPPSSDIPSIDWTEILTIILVSCMLIEEVHYFFMQDSLTFRGKLKIYLRDLFKPITFFGFLLFYIGLILRFQYAGSEWDFTAARVVMAFDIELWWLRCLSFIIVFPFLGPHLVAIGKMLKDLLFFLIILAIVMIGYGVASRSMVYYPAVNGFTTADNGTIDTSFDGRSVFHQVLYPVYYLLYGRYGTEFTSLDGQPNAGWSIATHVILAAHMMFVNVLLINLLIALFSTRFEEVHADIKKIWYSQQYLFTREYYLRSAFMPPISLFYDVYNLCRLFYFFIKKNIFRRAADGHRRVFKMIPIKKELIKELYDFESASTYQYAQEQVKESQNASTTTTSNSELNNTKKKADEIQAQKDKNIGVQQIEDLYATVQELRLSIDKLKSESTRKDQNTNSNISEKE